MQWGGPVVQAGDQPNWESLDGRYQTEESGSRIEKSANQRSGQASSREKSMLPMLSVLPLLVRHGVAEPLIPSEDPRGSAFHFSIIRSDDMPPAIGYAIREQNRLVLDDPAINAAEFTFERADDPLRVERYIRDQDFDLVSVHALKLSVAGAEPPAMFYIDKLRAIALENGAESVSDHLGFTRDGVDGMEIGHFAPPPFVQAALDATCRNIDQVQAHLADLKFFVENIAYLFRLNSSMTEAEFLRKMLARTGCGWLLDVTNVYANALNFGFDGHEFIAEVMPSAARVQIHLAGGVWDEKSEMYIDSHSHPIPDAVWDLYRYALELGQGKVEAVFVERDQNFPDENGWREEIRTVRNIAEKVEVPA